MNRPVRAPAELRRPCATPFESIALLLQGGGALGSYQAGVYEALLERGIEPTWIAGISIGAINSAIIAGNPVGERVARLRAFWELVSDAGDCGVSAWWTDLLSGDAARGWVNQLAAGAIMSNGVRGFFSPRFPPPYLMAGGSAAATSWYNTSGLRTTLEGLVDFDRINARTTRFSVGAVNVHTGNFAYFSNESDTLL
jgi:NTE family protein